MISKIKKPVSILLVFMMIVSLFTIVPITASAAEETKTVTWNSFPGDGGMSSGGVTLTTTQTNTRSGNIFYNSGRATFTAPEGSVFTKIELKNARYVANLNFPGATVAADGGYWRTEPWDEDEREWVSFYTVTWTGESSEVTFSGAVSGIESIVFTLKSVAPTTYTVTWKNGDTTLKTDTVDKDAIPAYSGDVPTKAASEGNHYTFSGWSNGTTTYGLNDTLPAVSADVTYTAQFTESAHSFISNPVFNWTNDTATGDWDCDTLTLTCADCGDTNDYAATGFFGASAVTVTANADGSFTYSVSKKVDGVTYSDTKTTAANGVVKSSKQLKAAAKKGGEWELGADLTGVTDVQCANGFVLDGNNHTVTRNANVSTQAVFRTTTNPAEVTLKNLTIDGIEGQSDSKPAVATKMSNPSDGNVINLENVTITNYDFDQANNGVVLAWGQATVNMTNCNVVTDSTYDVWGGAASKVNISGGTVGAAYLNGGSAQAAITDGATVSSITAANGSKIATDSPATISVGEDYKLQNNGDGSYTVVPKDYVAQVGSTKYESLAEAITAAQDGDTIKVLRNFTTAQTDIPAGKELTLDLGGYTVSGGSPIRVFGTLTIENGTISATDRAIQSVGTTTIEADAKIIAGNVGYLGFPGSVVYMDGEIEMTSAKDALVVQASGAKAYVSGRITTAGTAVNALGPCEVELKDGAYISGCTYGVYASLADPVGPTVVVRDGVTINATSYAITGNGSENRGKTTITIEGGELHGDDAAIFHPQEGTLTITGGTLEGGKNGIYMKSGTANISGGTIKGLGEKVDYEFKDSGWYPTGDAFTVDNSDYPGGVPSVTITGGTFISENADAVASYAKPGLTAIDHFVSGGYFSNRVDGSLCVEDCFSVGSALKPGMYIVDSLKNFEINADDAKDVDTNAFDLSGKYNKGTILGVQRKDKASVDARITSDSKQETGNDLRFVAVLDTEILNAADDYGFVLAKVTDGTKTYNTTNTVFDNLKKGDDRAKTISAKDTYNNVCGDELYGDPTDTTTAYKYITCAVNGLSDTDKVATRFYVTIDGKTYYAQYAGYNYAYTGCTAGMSLLG